MASEIEKAVLSYRRQVEAEEKEAMRRMARLWVPSRKLLMEKIRDLTAAIEAQQAKGESVWIGYVQSLDKYRELLRQTESEIRKYTRLARGEIAGKAGDVAGLGAEEASAVLKIADPSSPTSPVWTQVNRSGIVSAAGVTQNGTPLDSLLEKSFGEAKKGIESALITGIGTGQGWSWVADQMIKAADVPYERAVRIARTEINRSLREASYQSYKASGVVLGYRRMCFKPTACLACLMLDGEFTRIDAGPLSDHPNGKCTQVAVTRHYDPIEHGWQTGREWQEEQSEEDQRRIMGAGRFDLWKSSGADPKSMLYLKDNPIWGRQPGIKTNEQLKFAMASNLRQEGDDPSIPLAYQGDFSDYEPLDIDKETRDSFLELNKLARENNCEYGQVFSGRNSSALLTSNDKNSVKIETGQYTGSDLRLYHSHTNVSPLSSKDLRRLCDSRVSEVGCVAINGDTYIAKIGDGYKPDYPEFEQAEHRIYHEITSDLIKDPGFINWTEAKNYMFIKEKFFRIAREFGWRIEGGNLDELQ